MTPMMLKCTVRKCENNYHGEGLYCKLGDDPHTMPTITPILLVTSAQQVWIAECDKFISKPISDSNDKSPNSLFQ